MSDTETTETNDMPGIIRQQLEGACSYQMRLLRERFRIKGGADARDGFTDMFEESDPESSWYGHLGNRDYRIVYFLEAAFRLGACSAALSSRDHDEMYEKAEAMFEELKDAALGEKP